MRDILVVGWKSVSRQTKWTYPDTSSSINLAVLCQRGLLPDSLYCSPVRVQHRSARLLANDGFELQKRRLRFWLEGGVKSTNWNDKP